MDCALLGVGGRATPTGGLSWDAPVHLLEDGFKGGSWGEAIQNRWMESWGEGGADRSISWAGLGPLFCGRALACRMSANMLGRDSAEQLHVPVSRLWCLFRQLQQETAGPRCPCAVGGGAATFSCSSRNWDPHPLSEPPSPWCL